MARTRLDMWCWITGCPVFYFFFADPALVTQLWWMVCVLSVCISLYECMWFLLAIVSEYRACINPYTDTTDWGKLKPHLSSELHIRSVQNVCRHQLSHTDAGNDFHLIHSTNLTTQMLVPCTNPWSETDFWTLVKWVRSSATLLPYSFSSKRFCRWDIKHTFSGDRGWLIFVRRYEHNYTHTYSELYTWLIFS